MAFTLIDTDEVLDPEDHPTLVDAIARGGEALWSCHNWIVVTADGERVSSRVDLAKQRERDDRRLHPEAAA